MKNSADEYKGMEPKIAGGRGGISLRNLRTFSSLKNPVYRLYFGGMMGMMAGMNMRMMARSLLIYRITGSAAMLGVMALLQAIPMLALSLFGGVIADRAQKKHVLLVCLAGDVLVSLGIALALVTGYLSAEHSGSWWVLAAESLSQGVIMAFLMPSRQAIIPEIVSKEQVMNAVSLNVMGMNTLRILAPALTGFLVDAFDFVAVYYAMTGMYLIGIVFTAFLPLTSTMSLRGNGALSDIKEGLQYIRRETNILLILVFTIFAVVLSMPYILLMPIFTDDILKVGATGMGVLISVSGIGAIIGSLAFASLPNKKRGIMLLVSSLILGIALVGFSFSISWYLSLALIVFVGLGQSGRMTLGNTLLQSYTDAEYLGRVMSISMMEFGLASLGTFVAALLAEAMGVQWAVGGFAIALAFLSILVLACLPQIRKLD